MTNRHWRLSGLCLLSFCLVLRASAVAAAEVTLIGPGGARTPVMQLIPQFEKATGDQVKATFGSGGRKRPIDTLMFAPDVLTDVVIVVGNDVNKITPLSDVPR